LSEDAGDYRSAAKNLGNAQEEREALWHSDAFASFNGVSQIG